MCRIGREGHGEPAHHHAHSPAVGVGGAGRATRMLRPIRHPGWSQISLSLLARCEHGHRAPHDHAWRQTSISNRRKQARHATDCIATSIIHAYCWHCFTTWQLNMSRLLS
eukprot:4077692-Pleurochrysis_carterae.AAC.1